MDFGLAFVFYSLIHLLLMDGFVAVIAAIWGLGLCRGYYYDLVLCLMNTISLFFLLAFRFF